MTETQSVWDLLENPPKHCDATAELYHWSTNYDPGHGPFSLFLDLIGWSDENFGEPLFDLSKASERVGFKEAGLLGRALSEYADAPQEVSAFVEQLMGAESAE